jgi:hypothetical protein
MNSFRYRTKTLLGPWRATFDAAVQDAIRAKQARRDEDGTGWHWIIEGTIEERTDAASGPSGEGDFEYSPPDRGRA